jgi:small multidrug resistance pump
MHTFVYMLLAIGLEVTWAISLKFIKGWHSTTAILVTAAAYVGSVLFLMLATRRMDISTAYAIWAGSGVALIAMLGMTVLKEHVSPLKLASLLFIVLGVIGVHLADRSQPPLAG